MEPVAEDLPYAHGLIAVRDREFILGAKFSEQQSRANRKGANIDILDFERAMVRRMRRLHVPMFAHCILRTPEEQDALYIQGRSQLKGKKGAHVYGCAVDLIHGTRGWDLSRKTWELIGHIGKEVAASLQVKLVWGGDWDFFDPAHWELKDWQKLPHAVFADDPPGRKP